MLRPVRDTYEVFFMLEEYLVSLGYSEQYVTTVYLTNLMYFIQANCLVHLGNSLFLEEPIATPYGVHYSSLDRVDTKVNGMGLDWLYLINLSKEEQDTVFWSIVEFVTKYPTTLGFLKDSLPWQQAIGESKLIEGDVPVVISHTSTKDYYEKILYRSDDILNLISTLRDKTTHKSSTYGSEEEVEGLWNILIERYT